MAAATWLGEGGGCGAGPKDSRIGGTTSGRTNPTAPIKQDHITTGSLCIAYNRESLSPIFMYGFYVLGAV